MSQVRNYITLDSVINDYIDESEQSVHKYAKLYNIEPQVLICIA